MKTHNMDKLEEALQNPQISTFRNEDGNDLFLLALKEENLKALKLLTSVGKFFNHENQSGETAFSFAIERELTTETKLLLKASQKFQGCTINDLSLFRCAIKNNSTSCFRILLQMGVNPNVQDEQDGSTALMYAAEKGATRCISLLMKQGVDLNVQNHRGETALIIAARKKHLRSLSLLAGTNPYYKTANSLTVFSYISDPLFNSKLIAAYHSHCNTHILYRNSDISEESIAIRTKDFYTRRTLLILQTPAGRVERIYQQIKLSLSEKQGRSRGAHKICKPILHDGLPDRSVRLVTPMYRKELNTISRTLHFWETQSYLQAQFQNKRGLAKADLIVLTMNKRNTPTIDIYQKKYAIGDIVDAVNCNLSVETKLKFSLDILHGLYTLHSLNIAHCDIKPDNTLIDIEEAVLTDFDEIAFPNTAESLRGTPQYYSPELAEKYLTRQNSNFEEQKQADIWAIGITLYSLWADRAPINCYHLQMDYNNAGYLKNLHKLKESGTDLMPTPPKSDRFRNIFWEMLRTDPLKRPSIEYILNVFQTLTPEEISQSISQRINKFNFPEHF